MKKLRRVRVLSLIIVCLIGLPFIASPAPAKVRFTVDFGQDGGYESSWPPNRNECVSLDVYVSNVPEPGLISSGFILQYVSDM